MTNGELITYNDCPTIAFGIVKIPYDTKEIIQKASYFWSGIRYEKCKYCIYYSGEYYLEPFTEELNDEDLHNFKIQDNRLSDEYIRQHYKYLFVKIIEQN